MTEYDSVPLEIRAWADERTFEARVCNYNTPDSKGTSWAPGVFTRSLENKLPKAVWAHEWSRPIGRVTSYRDSAEGLDVTVQLADFATVPDAGMAHSLLKDGVIDEFSFGFYRSKDEPDPNHKGVTMITEADIKEISPVLVGSVPGTRTIAVRSAQGGIDVIEGLPATGQFSDEETASLRALLSSDQSGGHRTAQSETRSTFTDANLPKNAAGVPGMSMKRTPHKYASTNGDGSICKTCGGTADIKAHTRADTTAEIRDLAITIAADPMPETDLNGLVTATDAAVDAAIALASYQDMTRLPPWVAQMLALVMAADAAIDAAMELLGIPDPDDTGDNMYARALHPAETRTTPDPELAISITADIDRLATLGRRSRSPFP